MQSQVLFYLLFARQCFGSCVRSHDNKLQGKNPTIRGIQVKKPPFIRTPLVCPENVLKRQKQLAELLPPAGDFLGSNSFLRNPPLFVPDLEQGGFLTSIPLIKEMLHETMS